MTHPIVISTEGRDLTSHMPKPSPGPHRTQPLRKRDNKWTRYPALPLGRYRSTTTMWYNAAMVQGNKRPAISVASCETRGPRCKVSCPATATPTEQHFEIGLTIKNEHKENLRVRSVQ